MSHSLMQKVLGGDWFCAAAIQKHYAISGGQQSCVTGLMTIDYPASLFPLIWLAHLCGGLALWRGGKVRTRVEKSCGSAGRIALAAGDGARRRQGRLFPVADVLRGGPRITGNRRIRFRFALKTASLRRRFAVYQRRLCLAMAEITTRDSGLVVFGNG